MLGCAMGEKDDGPKSGNPAADMRAAQRVGDDDDDDKDGKGALTLYDRLGGEATIAQIVDDMTARVLADPRVNFERKNVQTSWLGTEYEPWRPTDANIDQFKQRMIEFIAVASGGPTAYQGREMREVHDGMHITNVEFDAFVGDLAASMDRLGIAVAEQRDLVAIIESTRKQIVEEP